MNEIKAWTRSIYDLDDGVAISVAEIACRDEDCPDIETVIGIMRPGEQIEIVRVHKLLVDILFDDLKQIAS
nr:nitrate reductase [Aurantimonas sp. CSK15Z-1]